MAKFHRSSAYQEKPFPWKIILIFIGAVFMTGLLYIAQEFSAYYSGSVLMENGILNAYDCPKADYRFKVSPIPKLFTYTEGNTSANLSELNRINKKNHGVTSDYSYDKGFNESAKAQIFRLWATETNENRLISQLYNLIKDDKNPHGGIDLVTPWLSPDDPHLPTVFPYSHGRVIEVKEGSSGYGNHVMLCSDLQLPNSEELRVLYGVAHLETISVEEGQLVSAGDVLGKIGSTGSSTVEHAHISITPNLKWVADYTSYYDSGYKFYYATSMEEVLVKTIPVDGVILNPDLAYSIVTNDSHRKGLFENPSQYIASLSGAVVFSGAEIPMASIIDEPKVFSDFRITIVDPDVDINEWVSVTVEALDQDGEIFEAFDQEIDVVLSTSTASFKGVGQMESGKTSFQVTDRVPGELIVQVTDMADVSEEKKVTFSDILKYLEVTSPQKMTAGNAITVVLRPIGSKGAVLDSALNVTVDVFPQISSHEEISVNGGRGEYRFEADQEGIYRLSFNADSVQESIQVIVEKDTQESSNDMSEGIDNELENTENTENVENTENTENTEDVENTDNTEDAEKTVDTEVLTIEEDDNIKPMKKDKDKLEVEKIEEDNVLVASDDLKIKIFEDEEYHFYEDSEGLYIVFDDREVPSDNPYPYGIEFTVPQGTQKVSVFTGYNSRNFPDTGELKLSKYTPGQPTVRYFPKYVDEDAYKKIIAYDASGNELASQVFTWSPGSQHPFLDVIEGITPDEEYQAIVALKEANVLNGNPDGTVGYGHEIQRAAVATILIRAFYSDVDLDELEFDKTYFDDVPRGAWYESAMAFASWDEYQGESKPIIIKGFEGKANPDGNVKLEEFMTMILRILEVNVEETDPWYEGYIAKSIDLKLITDEDRYLIDHTLTREKVALIMYRALEKIDELIPEVVIEDEKGIIDDVVEEEGLESDAEIQPGEVKVSL